MVLMAFVALSAVYSLSTPLFEAPDEYLHFLFAQRLANGAGLPDLNPSDPGGEPSAQEGGQAPLYYLLGALVIRWASPPDAELSLRRYPHGGPGAPGAPGKNVWIHGPEEDWPYRGPFLAARLLRFLSVLLGMLAVAGTFLAAREIWPDRLSYAVGSAALNAFNPQFLFISGAISNDPLAAAAGNWVAYLAVRLWRRGAGRGLYLALGVALGIALLSKASLAGISVLAVAVAIGAAVRRRLSRQASVERLLLLLVPPVAIAGWWYLRNLRLYGDPFALTVSALIAGGGGGSDSWQSIAQDLDGLRHSFWAVFGSFNIVADPAVYLLYDGLMLLAAVGLVLYAFRVWRRREPEGPALLFLLAGVMVAWAGLVRWRMLVLAFQGRLLFPVVGAIAILMTAGLYGLVPRRVRPWFTVALGLGLLVLAVAMPFRYIEPAYGRPAVLTAAQAAQLPPAAPVRFADQLELVAYELPARLEPGQRQVSVTLYWRALGPLSRDYSIFIHLTTPDDRRLGMLDTYPDLGFFPTSRWRPGEVLAGHYSVPVDGAAAEGETMLVTVGAYQVDAGPRLEVASAAWRRSDRQAVLGKVYGPGAPPRLAEIGRFGEQIAVLDSEAPTAPVRAGTRIEGLVRWRALQRVDRDYTAFVHLVGPQGLAAQYDSPPLGGRYPTGRWDAEEVVQEPFALDVPGNLPSGEYRVITGFYDPQTGQRLSASGLAALPDQSAIELGRVTVR